MPLYLFEAVSHAPGQEVIREFLADVDRAVGEVPAEVIEFQVTADGSRIFIVVESASADRLFDALDATSNGRVTALSGPHLVRLVGAEVSDIKAARPQAGYLVEWDLPAELDMDSYLARKKENAPKYADVPEVSFLRTYVREDMEKCLCLYDAPEERFVRKAREAVDTPIDRLHGLRPAGRS